MPDTTATRGTRPFRFGVVAPLTTDLPTWRDRVRRIADSGYSTLLMPDVRQWQPAPGPTLAFAAALADLRVGTWVYASPLRPAWSTAWEAHSLSVLTDGRFEMGVGTGRPGIEDELRDLGLAVVALVPDESRPEVAQLARDFRAIRDVELALHVSVIGDTVAPFMAPPDTDPAALRAVDSLAILPDDPAAASEEIQRRRDEIGFSYFLRRRLRRRARSGRS